MAVDKGTGAVIQGKYYPPQEPKISPQDTIDIRIESEDLLRGSVDSEGHAKPLNGSSTPEGE